MYIPSAYAPDLPGTAAAVMARFPFATLVSQDNGHLCATHVPLRFEAKAGTYGSLFGHVARANPQGLILQPDRETLAIFHGPHAYVSPTLYAQHPAVPTWHHVTVHATGFPRVLTDPAEILRHLAALVGDFESGPNSWSMNGIPTEYLDRMLGGIVAFELVLCRIETQCKLGQKRSDTDRTQVAQGLRATGNPMDAAVADWMESFPSAPALLQP